MCGVCGCESAAVAVAGGSATVHGSAVEHGGPHPHVHSQSHTHTHAHAHATHEHSHSSSHFHQPVAEARSIPLEQAILEKNDRFARENRADFRARGILAVNLVSSPGSGKTTLLERTILDLSAESPIFVIEGDQETDNDARRIRATGCSAVQINTGAGCHLDAQEVGRVARSLALRDGGVLFIENVGNLVCPAMFDLGEGARVVVLSVTEGEDKPIKYPHMFRSADAMVLSKVDLLPHLDFDAGACIANARRVNPKLAVFPVSVRRGEGLGAFYAWLRERHSARAKEAL